MDFIKQFLAENWEYILGVLGIGGAGIGSGKAYQKRKDSGQDKRIGKLETRMGEVEEAIEANTKEDLSFREKIDQSLSGLSQILNDFKQKYSDDKENVQAKTIEKLEKQVETLSRQKLSQ